MDDDDGDDDDDDKAENPLRKMIRGSDQILCCARTLDAKMVK